MAKIFENGKHALICYLMGGDPTPEKSVEAASAVLEEGADALELGIPFSDPIADGPTIQAASVRALKARVTPKTVFEQARFLSKHQKPIYLMTYLNPVLKMGYKEFAKSCVDSGVTGVIIPDLPVEYANEWIEEAQKNSLETVFLCSPSTKSERIIKISEASTGFVYLVSVYGVTGARESLPSYTFDFVKRVRKLTQKPLALGFGISTREHVKQAIEAGASGVIVGSALVSKLTNPDWSEALSQLRSLVRALRDEL
ncbi:tryptophan synthase subunit alpha [Candidatus Marsarchaeota G2 archaeon ECH_B_SAG-G16]|uniref:Tryptophan synthase alpha chain n=4 Tax=Candidatus Marsarchaeota TaxID=1978152 RepID=A0A2R6AC18_9ARCH|nr:MAG: tryptophan synthase subunit alpha [Candidatus Marsarchaeota G1 archaeon OSP_D]PSN88630.1 MAG: tryptophan synthase subunit alpha [Candidatus Marsarchaeota G1 archaeon OSP_C]PSN91701.1 MAG: tryptophan synthase subunit alpha [Candidatus Marsarchaeota G1 archaeon OSP_B]PSO04770.1 MAG: tryptophan synthase subunit alpha [Candidatus Marsarchaeota G2 archaeon ECH_B_SAG-G16]